VLIDLNLQAHRDTDEDRREVASLLWRAFLADLDHAFGRRKAVNWTFSCLVLLDNADGPAAQEFLTELVAARQERGAGDPVMVVVTSRGRLAEDYARQPGWIRLALPDLAEIDVKAMVRELELPAGTSREAIMSAVYRYTAGHPIAVGSLLAGTALAYTGAAPDPDLAAVLDWSAGAAGEPPLADALLRRLTRDLPAEAVEDLVTCSAARDLAAARRIDRDSELLGLSWGAAGEIFGAAFWLADPGGGNAVLHPVLRLLLLRRLAARPADSAAIWSAVHSWLRSAVAAEDQASELYHALALGAIEHVGRELAEAVAAMDAGAWLRLLEVVAAGLCAAMWFEADPLIDDRRRRILREEIHGSLLRIEPSFRHGISVLLEYARRYRDSAPRGDTGPGVAEPPPVSFVPQKSGRGIRRDRRIRALAAVAAIAVLAGAATGVYTLVSGGGPALCPGASAARPFQVVMNGGECVGVSDGSFVFDPGPSGYRSGILATEQAIAAENNAVVAGQQGYVTVALLTVLTSPPPGSTTPSDVTPSRIEDELRGAYLAQYHANHELGLHPPVRLLLASEGSTEQGWGTSWSELRQLPATGPGQLVAVTGMGISVKQTVNAAQTIGTAGIAMFGAVITADGLDYATSPLLDRVVPSVSDEVRALAGYLPKPPRSALVFDANTKDLYTASLRTDFKAAFGPSLNAGEGEIPYVPSTRGSPQFKKIAQDLCATSTPPLVFYAGRNSVFQRFVQQLELEGACNPKKLEIVTGGDADGFPASGTAGSSGGAQVTVVYADIENPNPANLQPGFRHDFETLLGRSSDQSMTDPWLLASYDAATAAANAIEDAEGSVSDPARLTASDVNLWVSQLNRSAAVAGATGTLQISIHGDLEHPAIPIIRLEGGQATILTVAK
jgi:hypothetical protein